MPYVFFRPAIAGRIVSSCGLSGPQLATGQPATAKRSFTISITTFYMCPKNKTQHTGQGFASTVLYICQHSRKLLSAKRSSVSAMCRQGKQNQNQKKLFLRFLSGLFPSDKALVELINLIPFRLKIAAAFYYAFRCGNKELSVYLFEV